MFSRFSSTEIEYTKKFSQHYENNEIIRFYDNELPGMYMHNFTLIKEYTSENRLKEIIYEELENRKTQNAGFLRVEFNFSIYDNFINNLPLTFEVSKYDYMYINTQMSKFLKGNEECLTKKAVSEDILNQGIEVDIIANQADMGIDFAKERIYRKAKVYKQHNSNLDLFVCYHNDLPIGNCELMKNNDIAKIEDFDIIENYQRQGFGTSMLKHIIEDAKEHGVELAYLITDSEDTAKEMYKKCGFIKVGEKTELFFDLSKY